MTIEMAMWFALGFLAAALSALVLMSALWRRAVRLTTRRVVGSVPADAEAAIAEKDLLAARFARDLRRYELALSDLRRRNTDERLAVGRQTEALDAMRLARDAETARAAEGLAREADLARRITDLDADLATRAEEVAAAHAAVEAHLETIADRDTTIATLERAVEARDVEISARTTQIAAREVTIDGLKAEIAEKKGRIDDLRRTLGLAETAVAQEKDRADRLDRRIERLVADVADREDVADRRHRELERARQALTSANARIAALTQRAGAEGPAGIGDNADRTIDLLEEQLRDLANRLEAAESERDRLAASVGERRREAGGDGDAPTRAVLRERIADFAAEMVRLAGAVEGEVSPLGRTADGGEAEDGPRPSLADRIRALRAADQGRQDRSPRA